MSPRATVRVIRGEGEATIASVTSNAPATVHRISAREIEADSRVEQILAEAQKRADAETIERRLAELAFDETARSRERALLVSAVRVVSERVIGDALRADDAALGRWIDDALIELSRAAVPRWIEIRGAPTTIARLAQFELAATAVRTVADASLGEAEVAITTNVGDAVVSVQWQVATLVERLSPRLDRALAEREAMRDE